MNMVRAKLVQPDVRPISENCYRLDGAYLCNLWDLFGKYRICICVPDGFIHDGASIPRFAWSITGIRPDGLHRAAALVHDFIYTFNPIDISVKDTAESKWKRTCKKFTRSEADQIFRYLMIHAGMNPAKVKMLYWAVRLFGGRYWKHG